MKANKASDKLYFRLFNTRTSMPSTILYKMNENIKLPKGMIVRSQEDHDVLGPCDFRDMSSHGLTHGHNFDGSNYKILADRCDERGIKLPGREVADNVELGYLYYILGVGSKVHHTFANIVTELLEGFIYEFEVLPTRSYEFSNAFLSFCALQKFFVFGNFVLPVNCVKDWRGNGKISIQW